MFTSYLKDLFPATACLEPTPTPPLRVTTPEKRRALEAIFGRETFQSTDTGLESLSTSATKLQDSADKAR